ncbi:MAG: hypothetical protein H6574_19180 [Lewinellaceae bacterium]|nr:hypothetical protein [Lewinellaceae bacterium]
MQKTIGNSTFGNPDIVCLQQVHNAAQMHPFYDRRFHHGRQTGYSEENPERGWGQLLPEYFEETLTIKNHAVNGRSTRSFIDEGRWAAVLDALQPGDYVFIQFGHNDQKENDPTRYTNPYTAYRRNLENTSGKVAKRC